MLLGLFQRLDARPPNLVAARRLVKTPADETTIRHRTHQSSHSQRRALRRLKAIARIGRVAQGGHGRNWPDVAAPGRKGSQNQQLTAQRLYRKPGASSDG